MSLLEFLKSLSLGCLLGAVMLAVIELLKLLI